MSGNPFRVDARHRLLSDPSLRADVPDRHLVVGVFLDQRRVEPGARHHRSADRAAVYTHTHTHLTALFRDYPGEPVPER